MTPEKIEKVRRRIKAKLAAKRTEQQPQPEPRYDEIFWAGLQWVDGLAYDNGQECPPDEYFSSLVLGINI